jgi:hypothetical protein
MQKDERNIVFLETKKAFLSSISFLVVLKILGNVNTHRFVLNFLDTSSFEFLNMALWYHIWYE